MTNIVVTPKILRRERTPGEYEVYRAALEWDLLEPIVIEDRADLRSEDVWKDRIEPFHHQVTNLITFCRRLPVTLLADDVGLGKTISAGLIVTELRARSRVAKLLVVAPKILGPQWKEELETKFGMEAEVVAGRNLMDADPEEGGAVITTYNTARLHLDKLPKDRFDMLILDEAHKLRNLYGVEKPPQVAVRFQKALEERRFRYVLMLTATPIQNRLWDLYSLVDLLSVARGHANPFGTPGVFARKFIADDREKARQLKLEAKDEFRSVVYSYMSRVRRGDAQLYFPDRVVQMHKVQPSPGELQLISTIARPIQALNPLVQISILQALASSPEALSAQLSNMAAKGSVPAALAEDVKAIVRSLSTTAKLTGLGSLIEKLRAQNPENWRVVIFTTRRETQTTIEQYLGGRGIAVGVINGSTGPRNQETIAGFRNDPPKVHAIVSTEAGSEGVNLQVANVLVNYDLPWNPMIVEQRIGRVQRLASAHKSVAIFNVMLAGTFEEYIVGRLMEKLQMASHAIGDIESLLEASGVGDDDEGGKGFEEQVRDLVVRSLAGKDVQKEILLREKSIETAKIVLEQERQNIDSMLGDMQGSQHVGPRAPEVPPIERSMPYKDFVRSAVKLLGGHITRETPDAIEVIMDGAPSRLCFNKDEAARIRGELVVPGSPAFSRLVDRVSATGVHRVDDLDEAPERGVADVARAWLDGFGGRPTALRVQSVERLYQGRALVRVRATVQHDSYETLVLVDCPAFQSKSFAGKWALSALPATIETIDECGLDAEEIAEAAKLDEGVGEFCRFYLERREQEVRSAGDDARKRAKLHDEFTPRLEITIAGLEGSVQRSVALRSEFTVEDSPYSSLLRVDPRDRTLVEAPPMARCDIRQFDFPSDCIETCAITGRGALRHLLARSELSGRYALHDHVIRCPVTGKTVLVDETETSDVTGEIVARGVLVASEVSGRRAEPGLVGQCAFTGARGLHDELAESELSGRPYRSDQPGVSSVSGKRGHRSEFVECFETRQLLGLMEAETCAETGKHVRPGVLMECQVSGKRVLPSQLATCAASGKTVLKSLMVQSSVSGSWLLPDTAIVSSRGRPCVPRETLVCSWSNSPCHPEDIQSCALIGLPIHHRYLNAQGELAPLREMLDGLRHTVELRDYWPDVANALHSVLRGARCRIEACVTSPSGGHVAVRSEARTMLGMRLNHAGALYSIEDRIIVGRVVLGRVTARGWNPKD